MTEPTGHFLLGLAVTLVVLFLFFGLTFSGIVGILFMVCWIYVRNHNLYFYLMFVASFAIFYVCARAGYAWVGGIGICILINLKKVLRMYEDAKPDEIAGV